MNIVFIYPSRLDDNGQVIKYRRAYLPPLALAILDSLTPEEHPVQIVNDCVEQVDYSMSPDIVGITIPTSAQATRAYQLADHFMLKGSQVILGGMHATVRPEEAKQHADAVVIGEAETLWEDILDDAQMILLQPFYQAPPFPDLDRLILPNWQHLDLACYLQRPGYVYPLMPIYTTRGCPYGCEFCSVTHHFGKSYRFKPIANVLQEIQQISAEEYFFVDDNIMGNPDYSRELFQALIGKNIRWFSQASTLVLKHPDLIDLAAQSGCGSLFLGIESINPQALASVRKGFNQIECYEELFAQLYRAGIVPFVSLIFGFDDDTPDTFERTLQFLKRNHIMIAVMWLLTPLPGTPLFDRLERENRILHTDWSKYDFTHMVFQPKQMAKDELVDVYWQTLRQFYSLDYTTGVNAELAKRGVPYQQSLFFQVYGRKQVNAHESPFSSGIERITDSETS